MFSAPVVVGILLKQKSELYTKKALHLEHIHWFCQTWFSQASDQLQIICDYVYAVAFITYNENTLGLLNV